MAFASSAVPDCWAAAKPVQQNSTDAANGDVVNQGLGQSPGHSYGGYKESGIGREFSLEGMLESYTQRKNVTVNLTH
jgi:hypothetical protein